MPFSPLKSGSAPVTIRGNHGLSMSDIVYRHNVKTLRLLLFCALAIPASLSAAGHEASAVRLTTLPCCDTVALPKVTSAWDGTRFLTHAYVASQNDFGMYSWFSDASPALAVTSFASPEVFFFPFSGRAGQYFGLASDYPEPEFVNLDSEGRLLSSVPLDGATNYFSTPAYYNGKQLLLTTFITNDIGTPEYASLTVYDVAGHVVNSTNVAIQPHDRIAAAAAGDGFVFVAAGIESGVRIYQVRADGTVSPEERIASLDSTSSVSVTVNSDHNRTAIVWTYTDGHGYAAMVSADGQVSSPTSLPHANYNGVSLFSLNSG